MASYSYSSLQISALVLFGLLSSSFGGVPVLLWESNKLSEKEVAVPALNQLDGDEFSNHLARKVHAHRLLIVIFVEPTLSVEDFSWKDEKRQGAFPSIENITGMAARMEFIPSVLDPVASLKDLVQSQGYSYQKYDRSKPRTKPGTALEVVLSDPYPVEDRPQLLRRHDVDITRIYSDLLASAPRIIAIFTGRQNSWVEADVNRVRRDTNASSSEDIVWTTDFIRIVFKAAKLTVNGKTYDLGSTTEPKNDDRSNFNRIIITYSVPEGNSSVKIILRIRFNTDKTSWSIGESEVEVGSGTFGPIVPKRKISAPMGQSFSDDVVTLENTSNNTTLVFTDFRAERLKKAGQKYFSASTVEGPQFFTGPIWMGVIVSWTLLIILALGITMLMDIKTMDRFDDPKGKTITVNAVD